MANCVYKIIPPFLRWKMPLLRKQRHLKSLIDRFQGTKISIPYKIGGVKTRPGTVAEEWSVMGKRDCKEAGE